jgi:hypothetical protein
MFWNRRRRWPPSTCWVWSRGEPLGLTDEGRRSSSFSRLIAEDIEGTSWWDATKDSFGFVAKLTPKNYLAPYRPVFGTARPPHQFEGNYGRGLVVSHG